MGRAGKWIAAIWFAVFVLGCKSKEQERAELKEEIKRELLAEQQKQQGAQTQAMGEGIQQAIAARVRDKTARRHMTTQAVMNVRKMYDSAISYYESEHSDANGNILPKQFPASVAVTPAKSCCQYPDGKCPVDENVWKNPTWVGLNFSVDDPHYYRYEFQSSGTDAKAKFVALAYGDLDCNGVFSTFERIGSVDSKGDVQTVGGGLYVINDIE